MDTMKRVKELAAARELTLYQLSLLSRVPYNTLKRTEKRSGQLSVDTIEKICRGLRMPLCDFFREDVIPARKNSGKPCP